MKVLVTGASGQVGQAVLGKAPDWVRVQGLTRPELDLSDSAAIHELVKRERPDWVINAGAYTAVDKAESEPELAHAINAGAPAAFAEALSISGGRLLQISTDFVFDGRARQPYATDAQRNPLSVYGRTKAAGEDHAGNDAIILRTSWVYAAGGGNFVRTMLRLMRKRDELSVVNDQLGSPSWAADIARVIWSLIERGAPGIYHHHDAGETSWHGFAQAIAEDALELALIERVPMIHPIPSSDYPTPAIRPAYSVLDDSATRTYLNDNTNPWRENLRAMLQEEKALA